MRLKSLLRNLILSACTVVMAVSLMGTVHAKAIEGVVNINTASVNELMLLPGIGKAKAEQIVQIRQSKPFGAVDELASIKGLGGKRIEAMRAHIVFTGPTTAKKLATPKAPGSEASPSGAAVTKS